MISANIDKVTRKHVYRREGYRCALCGDARHLQIHHVIPRGQGGPGDHVFNMVALCPKCHALAHGTDIDGLRSAFGEQFSPENIEQCIVEYLSDYYAEQGVIWNPWEQSPFERGRAKK